MGQPCAYAGLGCSKSHLSTSRIRMEWIGQSHIKNKDRHGHSKKAVYQRINTRLWIHSRRHYQHSLVNQPRPPTRVRFPAKLTTVSARLFLRSQMWVKGSTPMWRSTPQEHSARPSGKLGPAHATGGRHRLGLYDFDGRNPQRQCATGGWRGLRGHGYGLGQARRPDRQGLRKVSRTAVRVTCCR